MMDNAAFGRKVINGDGGGTSTNDPFTQIVKSGGAWQPLGYAQLTCVTATGFGALPIPTGATRAIVIIEGGDVRYRDDGTNPTAALGMTILNQQQIEIRGAVALSQIKFIQRSAGTPATINVAFYK